MNKILENIVTGLFITWFAMVVIFEIIKWPLVIFLLFILVAG